MSDRPRTEGGVWGSYVEYLKELEAERDRLREERDEAVALYNIGAMLASEDEDESALVLAHREIARLREDYAEAQAGWDKVSDENDRLREALEKIAAQHGWCTEVQTHVLARQALEGTSDE